MKTTTTTKASKTTSKAKAASVARATRTVKSASSSTPKAKARTTASSKTTSVKKPVAKKRTTTVKKVSVKKVEKTAPESSAEVFAFSLHEAPSLDPVIPMLPDLPEPPAPLEMGICQHCHLLPATAFELVIVMSCLLFSLSSVLLTSTQTIERQRDVIATLQQVRMDVLVRK